MKLVKIHITILLVLLVNIAQSSEPRKEYFDQPVTQRDFDKNIWEETTKDLDYTVVKKKKKQETNRPRRDLNFPDFTFNTPFWRFFFKFLIILGIIIVTVMILVNMLGMDNIFSPRSRKIKSTDGVINIENIEDNIYESDLDRFIRQAVEQQNYALAIRLYYLAIIKELSLNKAIKWKRDKTNKDYLREMRKSPLSDDFRETTSIFERIWYGNKTIDERDYMSIKPKFQALVSSAKNLTRT